MAPEKVLFKSEEPRSASEIAEFLRQLAAKVEQRSIALRRGTEEVTLALPDKLVLELKAEEEVKKGKIKRSFEVEIEWLEGEDARGRVELL